MTTDAGGSITSDTMNGTRHAALDWLHIDAWTRCLRLDLAPSTLTGIISLSASLAAQINASVELEAEVPFDPGKEEA